MGIVDRSGKTILVITFVVVIFAVCTAPVNAQSADLKVVSATWGKADKAIDVTERVTALLNDNQTVSPQQIASSDPEPGTYKTLTIHFEIENHAFIFSADEAYGRLTLAEVLKEGLTAVPLKVISATWGTSDKQVDVTKRVAELLEGGDAVDQRPETLKQDDPAYGIPKTIFVKVRVGSHIIVFSSEALTSGTRST